MSSPAKGDRLSRRARGGEQGQFADGKFAFLQRLHHFDSDGSGGSDDGDVHGGC